MQHLLLTECYTLCQVSCALTEDESEIGRNVFLFQNKSDMVRRLREVCEYELERMDAVKVMLDLGTQLGWAAVLDGASKMSGSESVKPRKHENWSARFVKARKLLDGLEMIEPIDGVWYEAVRRHNGTDAAHVYGGFLAMVDEWCDSREVPCVGVPVQTIKKFATGKGNASKSMMIEAVEDRFSMAVSDDNEADAVALREYVIDQMQLGKAA